MSKKIETLFGAFKSRGFNLEDTRVVNLERSERLFALLVVGLTWAVLVGEFLVRLEPLRLWNHGFAVRVDVQAGLGLLAANPALGSVRRVCAGRRGSTSVR